MQYTEKNIEDYLINNIEEHFPELKFIAQQFNVDSNYIDLILKDKVYKNDYYIVELKRGTINSDAIVQVLTYKRLMEINYSKEGKRRFIPVVIGEGLADNPHLYKLLQYFEPDGQLGYEKIFYRCHSLTLDGLVFNFANSNEIDFRENNEPYLTKIDAELEEKDYLELSLWELKNERS